MRMIKVLLSFSILILLAVTSCKKDNVAKDEENTISEELPFCIEEILKDTINSMQLKTIQAITLNNEVHYWLNTDFRLLDGSEAIVNEQCDTVCGICSGCILIDPAEDCTTDYDFNNWQIIWQP